MNQRTAPAESTRRSPFVPAEILYAIVPALLVLAMFAPSLRYEFVWDDERLIVHNVMLRSADGLLRALRSDFWLTVGERASGFWRPLITLSYAVDGRLFGWKPWGFHLFNMLAAAGVASLVALLARRLGTGRWAALAAGAWFALMPHHVESTAWIAGRTDLYSAFFFLLALLLDRRAADAGARAPGWGALVAFTLALLAKEASVLFLVVAFAWRWSALETRRGAFANALRWTAPYLAVTAVYLALHFWWVPAAPPPQYLSPETLHKGRLAAWAMYPGYLSFLSPFYPHSPAVVVKLPGSWRDLMVLSGAALQLATVVALAWTLRRRSPWAIALLVFWVTLLPTTLANLFQTYLLYSERFMYLPSIGAAWLLALALAALARRPVLVRGAAAAGAAVLVVASGWASARTLPDWHDDDTLYSAMTVKQPRNAMGWILLARHRLAKGDEAAAEHALHMLDGLETTRPEMLSVRALLHYRKGEWPQVVEFAERAIALDPTLGEPRLARAAALLRMGRMADAEAAIRQLEGMLPENSTVASLEGQRLLALRRPDAALPYLRRAAQYLHDDPDLFYALGLAHAMLNQLPPARAAFEASVELDPELYDGWLRLATACHLLGDFAARDAALARAEGLPEAGDGRAADLRARLANLR
ncbi:MAG: hypothetical protein U0704_09535 [Candidatus Eisenbacteria bacterium]